MSDYAYENREAQEAFRQLREVENAPLADRREACAEFADAMKNNPSTVAERVGWLLDGSYGYGAMQMAKRVIASPRSNQRVNLTTLVSAFEWQCPGRMAIAAWKKLSQAEKKALDDALDGEIYSYWRDKADEGDASAKARLVKMDKLIEQGKSLFGARTRS